MNSITRFFHCLSTSRYTRQLEKENEELKQRLANWEKLLLPRLVQMEARAQAVVTQEAKPVESAKAVEKVRAKTCAECQAPYTGNECPQCGAVKVVNNIPRKRGWNFGSFKNVVENQLQKGSI